MSEIEGEVITANYSDEVASLWEKNYTLTIKNPEPVSWNFSDLPIIEDREEKEWQGFATEQFLNGYDMGDAIYDKLSKGRRSNT